ncbi:SDR family oxidoreductase [Micromonospora matsumotoense]|uniref:SDR family oxidoreductase n=1 Tax=Micromonospora matsumotoense TaxID=121616 RepID=UPI003D8D4A3C
MLVFVTGATGFIGTAVVRELLDTGHQVLGLARSEASAAVLTAAGARVHRGSLDDVASLRAGAAAADGVIHTAFIHDFTDFGAAVAADLRAVEALGDALVGSDRPLVVTSGTTLLTPGRVSTEDDDAGPAFPRGRAEKATLALAERGVRASVLRLPPSVHGVGDRHGFLPRLIDIARVKGFSAYADDGTTRWAAVHRLDAAGLFRRAVESAPAGSRLHGVGDEGVPFRDIAEAIGRRLGVPVTSIPAGDTGGHFGFLGPVVAHDTAASGLVTRKLLGWEPVNAGLLDDLDEGHYFSR